MPTSFSENRNFHQRENHEPWIISRELVLLKSDQIRDTGKGAVFGTILRDEVVN